MHTRNTEIFCEIAEQHSFSKAALTLEMSQSAASQAVQQLEDSLDVTLIDRSTRPLSLTPAGDALFAGAQRLLREWRELEDNVREFSAVVCGSLRVTAIYSVGLLRMAETVETFRTQYPSVDFRLDYCHPGEVYDLVRRGEAELGLISFPKEGSDLRSILWQEQEMCLAVAAGHPLSSRESVSLGELEGEPFVAFTDDLPIRATTDRLLRKARVRVEFVHEFDNIEMVKSAVDIHAGVAILPRPTMLREIAAGQLVAVPFTDVNVLRPLGIIHRRSRHLSVAAEKFIELLKHQPVEQHPDHTDAETSPSSVAVTG